MSGFKRNWAAYIGQKERWIEQNNRRWQRIRANVEFETIEWSLTAHANQEDHVYLREVLRALQGRKAGTHGQSRDEMIRCFIRDCDANRGRRTEDRLSVTEKDRVTRTRKWLRAWAEENA